MPQRRVVLRALALAALVAVVGCEIAITAGDGAYVEIGDGFTGTHPLVGRWEAVAVSRDLAGRLVARQTVWTFGGDGVVTRAERTTDAATGTVLDAVTLAGTWWAGARARSGRVEIDFGGGRVLWLDYAVGTGVVDGALRSVLVLDERRFVRT